jgi:hypothetical protein
MIAIHMIRLDPSHDALPHEGPAIHRLPFNVSSRRA